MVKQNSGAAEKIQRANTLPARFYREEAFFDAVREKIFTRAWHLVGDVGCVKVPGQVHPFTLLEGFMDEPLLLTRDQQDEIHCLSNVCTHRGNLVVRGSGREKALRCGYHGRRFALDGKFEFMPEFDCAKNFPSAADHLPKIPFALWAQFIFASPAPACPLEKLLGDMQRRVGWLPLNEFFFDASRSRDYLVHANWALYCDNYLEGFHVPYVHDGLAQTLDYGSYTTEIFPFSVLQTGIAKNGGEVLDLPADSPDYGKAVAAYYFWLFPNLMFNFYPWGLSINIVKPLATDRTKVSYLTYVWKPDKLGKGAGAMLDKVEREDEAIVEDVQKGMRSRFYTRGRYSPAREQGVFHFHSLIQKFIGKMD